MASKQEDVAMIEQLGTENDAFRAENERLHAASVKDNELIEKLMDSIEEFEADQEQCNFTIKNYYEQIVELLQSHDF